MRVFIIATILLLSLKYGHGEDILSKVITENSVGQPRETSEQFRRDEGLLARAPKFLSFNKEANKLRVEASFAVPLLSIPVGGETSNAHEPNVGLTNPKVDVNLKSVVTVASIFLLVFVILPKLLRFPPPVDVNPHFRSSRDDAMTTDDIFKLVSDSLNAYGMDLESCTQKAVCWTMNNVVTKANEVTGNVPGKFLDSINSGLPYLKYLFGDTWLWPFLQNVVFLKSSEYNENCDQFNKKCVITSNGLKLAIESLIAFMRSKNLDTQ